MMSSAQQAALVAPPSLSMPSGHEDHEGSHAGEQETTDGDKVIWTHEMTVSMLRSLKKYREAGQQFDKLSADGYNAIVTELKEEFGDAAKNVRTKSIQNRMTTVKKAWEKLHEFKAMDVGLGWDPRRGVITWDSPAFTQFCERNLSAAALKKRWGSDPSGEWVHLMDQLHPKNSLTGQFVADAEGQTVSEYSLPLHGGFRGSAEQPQTQGGNMQGEGGDTKQGGELEQRLRSLKTTKRPNKRQSRAATAKVAYLARMKEMHDVPLQKYAQCYSDLARFGYSNAEIGRLAVRINDRNMWDALCMLPDDDSKKCCIMELNA